MQEGFRHMVFTGRVTFTARLGSEMTSEQFSPTEITAFKHADAMAYYTGPYGKCDGGAETFAIGQVFAHELVHHFPVALGRPMNPSEEDAIVKGDNVYNAQRGKAPRCNHQGF
jgi:hypothetical protein